MRVLKNPNGTFTIEDERVKETMHSKIGPDEEAKILYIQQSGLREKLKCRNLVVFDVGFGAGANAIAALNCQQTLLPDGQHLTLVSFENRLEGIHLALEHLNEFTYLNGYKEIIQSLIKDKIYESQKLKWILLDGNFLEQLALAPSADIVFYDFYSPKTQPEMWTTEVFQVLYKKLNSKAELYTYTCSRQAREALCCAGFQIRAGVETSAKRETTVAFLPC